MRLKMTWYGQEDYPHVDVEVGQVLKFRVVADPKDSVGLVIGFEEHETKWGGKINGVRILENKTIRTVFENQFFSCKVVS